MDWRGRIGTRWDCSSQVEDPSAGRPPANRQDDQDDQERESPRQRRLSRETPGHWLGVNFPDAEEVVGSNPSAPTREPPVVAGGFCQLGASEIGIGTVWVRHRLSPCFVEAPGDSHIKPVKQVGIGGHRDHWVGMTRRSARPGSPGRRQDYCLHRRRSEPERPRPEPTN